MYFKDNSLREIFETWTNSQQEIESKIWQLEEAFIVGYRVAQGEKIEDIIEEEYE
jgi:hypothetical protein